ncbi:PASTA domain-containing protein [Actinomadura luteofluorescens]
MPVAIVVSTGMSMPGLLGQNGDTAANQLRSMGLDVTVKKKQVNGKDPNTVIEQDPSEGTGVSRGDKVTIVVNKRDCIVDAGPFQFGCDDGDGNQNVPIPDLTGLARQRRQEGPGGLGLPGERDGLRRQRRPLPVAQQRRGPARLHRHDRPGPVTG